MNNSMICIATTVCNYLWYVAKFIIVLRIGQTHAIMVKTQLIRDVSMCTK